MPSVGAASAAAARTSASSVPNAPGIAPASRQMAGEAPGVDAGDPGDPVAGQEVRERLRRPPAARAPGEVAHDDAATERAPALVVVGVHAVVADVRIRERDDLARVATGR